MNKKMAAMFATMLIALSLVGVAYAMWSETLILDGTVNTGNVDVEWSLHGFGSDETKNVSFIDAWIAGDTLFVTIDNAYPCVYYYVDFDIHCMGSIPVHIYGFDVTNANPGIVEVTMPYIDPAQPEQLHYCEEYLGRLTVHLTNDAAELDYYTFSVAITAYQYNELPPP